MGKPLRLPSLVLPEAPFVVISGCQRGVDQAGLDAARELGIPWGGWAPRGKRMLVDEGEGTIPDLYFTNNGCSLKVASFGGYPIRTEGNVRDSDGTVVVYSEKLGRGTQLTIQFADDHNKPVFRVDLDDPPDAEAFREWVESNNIQVVNIAGSSKSTTYDPTVALLKTYFGAVQNS